MATIKVDSQAMRDKATVFKNTASKIKTLTEEMTNSINSLKNTWEGESAENTVSKFKNLSGTFEEKCQTINNYAKYLEETASQYDAAEKQVNEGVAGK